MKNYKKLLSIAAAVTCLSTLLSSCLKQNDSVAIPNSSTSLVTVVQGSPDQPSLNFYLNNNLVNLYSLNYGDGLNYFRAYSGKTTLGFYTATGHDKIITDTVNLVANAAYSLFLANTPAKAEIVLLSDTLVQPSTGNASIRFANLSPDAPAVDLVIKGGSTLVTNKAFKGFSSFVPVPGSKTYTFEVHQTGTSTVLATLSNISLNTNYVYTIWFHGLAAPVSSTDKLSADIINNAYF